MVVLLLLAMVQAIHMPIQLHHNMYTVSLSLGTHHQPMRVDIDTGSDKLWVKSARCDLGWSTRCGHLGLLPGYQCLQSSTCHENILRNVTVEYGIGKVKGIPTLDSVHLQNLTVPSMPFIQATYSRDFGDDAVEGILGLGFTRHSNTDSLVDQLKHHGQIDRRVFCLTLDREPCSESSLLSIGQVDQQAYHGPLTTLPVLHNHRWVVPMLGIKLGQHSSSQAWMALVDSGNSGIALGKAAIREFIRLLAHNGLTCRLQPNSQGVPMVECSTWQTSLFPTLSFLLGDAEFTLSPGQYIRLCFIEVEPICQLRVWEDPGSLDREGIEVVLGMPFLQSVYSVFDLDNQTISFASRPPPPDPPMFTLGLFWQQLTKVVVHTYWFMLIGLVMWGWAFRREYAKIHTHDTLQPGDNPNTFIEIGSNV